MAIRALPGSPTPWQAHRSHDANGIMHELRCAGHVSLDSHDDDANINAWRLTHAGLRALRPLKVFDELPAALSDARHGAGVLAELRDCSQYELLLMLLDAGWLWKKIGAGKKSKLKAKPYRVGQPLVFRTSGVTIPQEYLLCLLCAPELLDTLDIDEIPHGQSAEVYVKLLKGEKWSSQVLALQDAGARATRLLALAGPDGELVDELTRPPQIRHPLGDGEREENGDLSDLSDLGPHEDHGEEGGGYDEDASLPDSDDGDIDCAEAVVGEMDVEGGAGADVSPTLPPPPPPQRRQGRKQTAHRGAAAQCSQDHKDAVLAMRGLVWGVFTFTTKAPGGVSGGRFGGIQAECPFHRRTRTSGCRKYMSFPADTAEARHETLMTLKYWCAGAAGCARQWQHVFGVDTSCRPPDDTIEGMVITEGPTEDVIDDNAFYSGGHDSASRRGHKRTRAKSAGTCSQAAAPASSSRAMAQAGQGSRKRAARSAPSAAARSQDLSGRRGWGVFRTRTGHYMLGEGNLCQNSRTHPRLGFSCDEGSGQHVAIVYMFGA